MCSGESSWDTRSVQSFESRYGSLLGDDDKENVCDGPVLAPPQWHVRSRSQRAARQRRSHGARMPLGPSRVAPQQTGRPTKAPHGRVLRREFSQASQANFYASREISDGVTASMGSQYSRHDGPRPFTGNYWYNGIARGPTTDATRESVRVLISAMHGADERTFCGLLYDHIECVANMAMRSKDPEECLELITPFLEVRHHCSNSNNYVRAFDVHCQLLSRIAAEVPSRSRTLRVIATDVLSLLLDANRTPFDSAATSGGTSHDNDHDSTVPTPELSVIVFDTILQIIAVAPNPVSILHRIVAIRETDEKFFADRLAPFRAMRAEYLKLLTLRFTKEPAVMHRGHLRACVREVFISCVSETSIEVLLHCDRLWDSTFAEVLEQGQRLCHPDSNRMSGIVRTCSSFFASTSGALRRIFRRVPLPVVAS